jgi:hypothetical protein
MSSIEDILYAFSVLVICILCMFFTRLCCRSRCMKRRRKNQIRSRIRNEIMFRKYSWKLNKYKNRRIERKRAWRKLLTMGNKRRVLWKVEKTLLTLVIPNRTIVYIRLRTFPKAWFKFAINSANNSAAISTWPRLGATTESSCSSNSPLSDFFLVGLKFWERSFGPLSKHFWVKNTYLSLTHWRRYLSSSMST